MVKQTAAFAFAVLVGMITYAQDAVKLPKGLQPLISREEMDKPKKALPNSDVGFGSSQGREARSGRTERDGAPQPLGPPWLLAEREIDGLLKRLSASDEGERASAELRLQAIVRRIGIGRGDYRPEDRPLGPVLGGRVGRTGGGLETGPAGIDGLLQLSNVADAQINARARRQLADI